MPKQQVLFLCTGNSCRSQMVEGFLRQMAGTQFDVYSSGVKPLPRQSDSNSGDGCRAI